MTKRRRGSRKGSRGGASCVWESRNQQAVPPRSLSLSVCACPLQSISTPQHPRSSYLNSTPLHSTPPTPLPIHPLASHTHTLSLLFSSALLGLTLHSLVLFCSYILITHFSPTIVSHEAALFRQPNIRHPPPTHLPSPTGNGELDHDTCCTCSCCYWPRPETDTGFPPPTQAQEHLRSAPAPCVSCVSCFIYPYIYIPFYKYHVSLCRRYGHKGCSILLAADPPPLLLRCPRPLPSPSSPPARPARPTRPTQRCCCKPQQARKPRRQPRIPLPPQIALARSPAPPRLPGLRSVSQEKGSLRPGKYVLFLYIYIYITIVSLLNHSIIVITMISEIDPF